VSMCNGGRHACALSDAVDGKKVYCWGDNVDGELGLASPVDTNVALQVPGVSNVAGITCFGTSTCAWLADSTKSVTCWGTNDKGQLGDGTLIGRPTPKTVPGLSDVIGMDGSCAWTSTGDAWCWGDSYSGQAGIGISGNVTVPTDVKGL
jgi:alpha-tubulin suppressor-like RCC1 family protein